MGVSIGSDRSRSFLVLEAAGFLPRPPWVLAGVRHDAIYTQGCSLLGTLTLTRWHTSFAVFIFEVVQLQLGYSSTAKY